MIDYKPDISKDELLLLPQCVFEGDIIIIDKITDLDLLYPVISKTRIVGFDTETKPNFKKGALNPVALLQLATADTCFLIRLNKVKLPGEIIEILQNPGIFKIGVAIRDDIKALQKISPFNPESFIDLQKFVKDYGIIANSIKKIAGIVLKSRVSKNQQLSDWEAAVLNEAQQKYAATDAWVCLQVFTSLQNLE